MRAHKPFHDPRKVHDAPSANMYCTPSIRIVNEMTHSCNYIRNSYLTALRGKRIAVSFGTMIFGRTFLGCV